jgi:hypothetical protein
MASIKEAFGTSAAIACSIASLVTANGRESTALDNTSNLYLDALVYLAIKSGASVAGDKCCYIYAYGSEDGTNYAGGCTGSDAAYTPASPTPLRLVFVMPMPAATTTYKGVFSIAQAFGGVLPRKWGIVIVNSTGANLDSTEGNHAKSYTGVYATSA